jgi:hypothetical protein
MVIAQSESGFDGAQSNDNMKRTSTKSAVVFLFDVDNTLLDNDALTGDLKHYLQREVGFKRAKSYWDLFENLRDELGYADYLGALQQYRRKYPHDLHLLRLARYIIDYPFAKRLFPKSLEVLKRARRWGTTGLLTDGDVVFQPRKVDCSGLFKAVDGNVLIYVHKEQELGDVARRFPARHYVLVDDKVRILTAVKKIWGARVTTVFVRQGHYALDRKLVAKYPPADLTIESIGDFLKCEVSEFR